MIDKFKRKSWGLLVSLMIVLIFSSSFSLSYVSAGENILKYKVRSPRVSRLVHEITVINEGGFPAENMNIWIPIIGNETPYHFVIIKNVEATPSYSYKSFEVDSSNNTYIHWRVSRINPAGYFKVRIEYSVLSFDVKYAINSHQVGNYSEESGLYRNYTQPEPYIEADDPIIVETAKSIAGNETNPHILALKIADFVSKNLTYVMQDYERGARWALKNGKGDCSEFSYLFVALCRACGIPARVKVGMAFHSDNEKTSHGHMWAEYFLPNYGWVPVDPTWNQICRQDGLHFSLLHSFPIKHPYDTVFIEFSSRAKIRVSQTIEISLASIADFENFSIAKLAYDIVGKAEKIELLYLITTLMGARIFASDDYESLENTIKEFDLTVQQSLETNDLDRIKQANVQVEYILSLGEAIIFKCAIMLALTVLIAILIVYASTSRRQKIEDESTF